MAFNSCSYRDDFANVLGRRPFIKGVAGTSIATTAGCSNLQGDGTDSGTSTQTNDGPNETRLPEELNPEVHLAADHLSATDSDTVKTWNDLSGNGNHATQERDSAQPVYVADALAGEPALDFDGEDDVLRLDSEVITLDDFTLFVVARWDSKYTVMLDGFSPDNDVTDHLRIANFDLEGEADAFSYQTGEKTWWETNLIARADTDPHVFAVTSDADALVAGSHEVTAYLDGETVPDLASGTLNHSVSSRPGDLRLGGGYVAESDSLDAVTNGEKYFDGVIAEVVLFDTHLPDESIQQVNEYLADKYGQFGWEVTASADKPLQLTAEEVEYDGRAEDAPWRSAAQDRIEQHRKAPLNVSVTDADGNALGGASVDIAMQSHEFNWGTSAISDRLIGDSGNDEHYATKVEEKFNYATFENEMKVYNWEGDEETQSDIDEALTWLNDIGHGTRGHAAWWEVWWWLNMDEGSDGYYHNLSDSEIDSTVKDKIATRLDEYAGRLDDWDAQNHPFHRQRIRSYLADSRDGELEYVSGWWETAQQADTVADMGINEQNIVTRYPDSNHMSQLLDWVADLKDPEAPGGKVRIDDIGFMAHSPIDNLQDIPTVLDRIETFQQEFPDTTLYFSEFHVPLWQNYENWSNATSAMRDAQADYVRDFLTAAFSKENVETLVYWDMWAGAAWRTDSALYDEDWTVRPHGQQYLQLVFDEWWTEESGETDSDGRYTTSAFKGEYEITATTDGASKTVTTTVSDGGASVEVTLASEDSSSESSIL